MPETIPIGRAVAIFKLIERDDFSDEEKVLAIHDVMNMPTHNGITKADMIAAIKWLWNHCFYLENETEDLSNEL